MATNSDLDWLRREEGVSPAERFTGRYISRVLDALPEDQLVFAAFVEVQNLVQLPTYLFQPCIARHVL